VHPVPSPIPWPSLRLLVFDLDGTLIDSQHDLAASLNATLQGIGRPALPLEQVAGFVGDGAPALVARALAATGGNPEAHLQTDTLASFLRHYEAHKLDRTMLFPGVAEALPRLAARCRLAVLTNKPVAISRAILAGLGIETTFAAIYGGNSFSTCKPDPLGLQRLLEEAPAAPGEALMVGDTWVDIATGKNAGTWTCGVSYGFGAQRLTAAGIKNRPRSARPDVLFDDLRQLAELVNG